MEASTTFATQSHHQLPIRYADFATLAEALDYAALGETGMNFYDRRNNLMAAVPYSVLKVNAVKGAQKLLSLGLTKGDRVALIAETSVEFVETFFACQYAGLIAVPLAIPMGIGQSASYVKKLTGLLNGCQASVVLSSKEWLPMVKEVVCDYNSPTILSHEAFAELSYVAASELPQVAAEDIAYLQYTSGSTRFPRGVVVTQASAMANLRAISHDGIKLKKDDRCVSWLPFYHDMGLVGFVLTPVATQISVDYLRTQDFAMRPIQWLKLITKNKGTVSVAPPFGYEICLRRSNEKELAELDLSTWRIAGVGAEPIPSGLLDRFTEHFSQVGFGEETFMPCYGLAENTLAVSFFDKATGPRYNVVDRYILEYESKAVPPKDDTAAQAVFVNCGKAMPGHEIVIRNERDEPLPERSIGHICIAGPSLMRGYFRDKESHQQIQEKGWLDTGDLGYLLDGNLYITGRKKDLIIIRGRNIWPQDIEYIAEAEPEVRSGDAIAFMTNQEHDDAERIILQIQCRVTSTERRGQIVHSLSSRIRNEFGVSVDVVLVPPHSIPRTSSGKPARAEAKKLYLNQHFEPQLQLAGNKQ
ncbi:fatty-acyl-CoA synthase [Rosenbergiella nectarea]|uniref:Fatty-acyl-CoA synthase n=1 Tax=Rosenbergiella nectarea TaxID=988801 RepID=A0A1H9MAF5_9GAMM|nr:fatty acyl-AMP ligase [Rosenbergiella nectarea]SER20730.1 fatty-acyl-CoA synthase [Rosenbergiella nectarea]